MTASWAADYVGIPWLPKGRDRSGCDCWGLVRLVLAEQFGITQPSFVDDYASPDEVEIVSSLVAGGVPENGWHKVDGYGPRPGDGVVLRILNAPWHVGIMVNPDEFLHVSEGMEAGSVIDRLSSHRWARRVIGVFRHESLA